MRYRSLGLKLYIQQNLSLGVLYNGENALSDQREREESRVSSSVYSGLLIGANFTLKLHNSCILEIFGN